jgi:hypothetical protein
VNDLRLYENIGRKVTHLGHHVGRLSFHDQDTARRGILGLEVTNDIHLGFHSPERSSQSGAGLQVLVFSELPGTPMRKDITGHRHSSSLGSSLQQLKL